jgi:hypothetical protein
MWIQIVLLKEISVGTICAGPLLPPKLVAPIHPAWSLLVVMVVLLPVLINFQYLWMALVPSSVLTLLILQLAQ